MALARTGMLHTRAHTVYSDRIPICQRCGVYEETVKHVIFECNDPYFTEYDLHKRLGLDEEIQDPPLVSRTKRILENWEGEST